MPMYTVTLDEKNGQWILTDTITEETWKIPFGSIMDWGSGHTGKVDKLTTAESIVRAVVYKATRRQ
ncbi:MAG: hypothetical protein M0R06_00845 [Sphaerochaeta sp.]|nr:hypothetical protein [Sphaerochaeta sp.]